MKYASLLHTLLSGILFISISIEAMQQEFALEQSNSDKQNALQKQLYYTVFQHSVKNSEQFQKTATPSDTFHQNREKIKQLCQQGKIETAQAIAQIYKGRPEEFAVCENIINEALSGPNNNQKIETPSNKESSQNSSEKKYQALYGSFSESAANARLIENYKERERDPSVDNFGSLSRTIKEFFNQKKGIVDEEELSLVCDAWKNRLFKALNHDEANPLQAMHGTRYYKPFAAVTTCSMQFHEKELQKRINSLSLPSFDLTDFLEKTQVIIELTHQDSFLSALDIMAIIQRSIKRYTQILNERQCTENELIQKVALLCMQLPSIIEVVLHDEPTAIKALQELGLYKKDAALQIYSFLEGINNHKLLSHTIDQVMLPKKEILLERFDSLGLTDYVQKTNLVEKLQDSGRAPSALYVALMIEQTMLEYVQNFQKVRLTNKEKLHILDIAEQVLKRSLYELVFKNQLDALKAIKEYESYEKPIVLPNLEELQKELDSIGFLDFNEKTNFTHMLVNLQPPLSASDVALTIEQATMDYFTEQLKGEQSRKQLVEVIFRKKSLLYEALFKKDQKALCALHKLGFYNPS